MIMYTNYSKLRFSCKHAFGTLNVMVTRDPGSHVEPLYSILGPLSALLLMKKHKFLLRPHSQTFNFAFGSAEGWWTVAQTHNQNAVCLAHTTLCPSSVR